MFPSGYELSDPGSGQAISLNYLHDSSRNKCFLALYLLFWPQITVITNIITSNIAGYFDPTPV